MNKTTVLDKLSRNSTKRSPLTSSPSLASDQDEKWMHDRKLIETDFITYNARYLGAVEVVQPKGVGMVAESIKKLKIQMQLKKAEQGHRGSKLIKVEIIISIDSIRVIEVKSRNMICVRPLQRVSYCADDQRDNKLFAFIARENEDNKVHKCFVFVSEKEASEITLTLGQAFQLAYERNLEKEKEDIKLKEKEESMNMKDEISKQKEENEKLKLELNVKKHQLLNVVTHGDDTDTGLNGIKPVLTSSNQFNPSGSPCEDSTNDILAINSRFDQFSVNHEFEFHDLTRPSTSKNNGLGDDSFFTEIDNIQNPNVQNITEPKASYDESRNILPLTSNDNSIDEIDESEDLVEIERRTQPKDNSNGLVIAPPPTKHSSISNFALPNVKNRTPSVPIMASSRPRSRSKSSQAQHVTSLKDSITHASKSFDDLLLFSPQSPNKCENRDVRMQHARSFDLVDLR